jgi:hypothetical protein
MRVTGVRANRFESGRRPPPSSAATGRALVPAPAGAAPEARFGRLLRPDSTLAAQLFAIRDDWPQTRVARRASPATAVAAYDAVARLLPDAGRRAERRA